jgi:porphobilinogen synthase
VLLFGLPAHKDAAARRSLARRADRDRAAPAAPGVRSELVLAADVCLCPYTEHGHCGVLRGEEIDNDATLPLLAEQALAFARLARTSWRPPT